MGQLTVIMGFLSASVPTTLVDTSAYGPALSFFNDRLFLAWTGTDKKSSLNIESSQPGGSGSQLDFGQKVTLGEFSSNGPALAVFNDRIYLAWVGTDGGHSLNLVSSADGQNFDQKVGFAQGSQYSPALAVFDNRLYIAWTANDADGQFNVASSADGQAFGPPVQLQYTAASTKIFTGPALAVFNDALYIAWGGVENGGAALPNVLSSTDGQKFALGWVSPPAVDNPTLVESFSPALVALDGELYIVWPTGNGGQVYSAVTTSGKAPNGPPVLSNEIRTLSTVALVGGGPFLFAAYTDLPV